MEKLQEKRSEKTNHMSKEDDKFNDLVDYDIEVMPGTIWEELNMFNEDLFESKLTLDYNTDKQHMTIEMADPETGLIDFKVKAKFFALNNTEEDSYEGEPMR